LNDPEYAGSGPKVKWFFNASRAPWWGGFYERMMHMIKNKLAKLFITHQQKYFPTMDAFREAVAWTQLVLNSRPVSWNPTCGKYGQPVLARDLFLPTLPDFDDPFHISVVDGWLESASQAELQTAVQIRHQWQNNMWELFQTTYLSELRKRRQEHEVPETSPLLAIGQVVFYKKPIIGQELSPMKRLTWRMARLLKLHPGRDRRVRSVDIEFFDSKRDKWVTMTNQSIRHIAPLEVMLHDAEREAVQVKASPASPSALPATNRVDTNPAEHMSQQASHATSTAPYALRSKGPVPDQE
jgi:hypothetical protein